MGKKKNRFIYITLILAPIACIFFSLCVGRYPLAFTDVIRALISGPWSKAPAGQEILYNIIWEIRLPRALLGCLVGASLAISGTAFQGLFQNPLVSSGILGVSSGSGFGAALAIILFNTVSAAYPFALFFGITAVICSYLIGRLYGQAPAIMLVLGE